MTTNARQLPNGNYTVTIARAGEVVEIESDSLMRAVYAAGAEANRRGWKDERAGSEDQHFERVGALN